MRTRAEDCPDCTDGRTSEGEICYSCGGAGERHRRLPARFLAERFIAASHGNTAFRRVLGTVERTQYVAMTLRPGESIGLERHPSTTQHFWVVSGHATVYLAGKRFVLRAGGQFAVAPGQAHDVATAGRGALHLLTAYTPPMHREGLVQERRQRGASRRANPRRKAVNPYAGVGRATCRLEEMFWLTFLAEVDAGGDPEVASLNAASNAALTLRDEGIPYDRDWYPTEPGASDFEERKRLFQSAGHYLSKPSTWRTPRRR